MLYFLDKVLRDDIRFELDLINRATGIHFTEIPLPPEDEKIRWVFFVNRKGLQGCDDIVFQNFTTEGVQVICTSIPRVVIFNKHLTHIRISSIFFVEKVSRLNRRILVE